jgi:hypothetical protein
MEMVQRMHVNMPKLIGLFMQNISQESKVVIREDADYLTWFPNKDPEKIWQALKKTHKVDSISIVKKVVEMTTRKNYQMIKQGGFESLTQFSKRFRAF